MELEQTADGSYTLYVPELDEHYHSVKGALTESQHIFIEMGLKHSGCRTAYSRNRTGHRPECFPHPADRRRDSEESILYRHRTVSAKRRYRT